MTYPYCFIDNSLRSNSISDHPRAILMTLQKVCWGKELHRFYLHLGETDTRLSGPALHVIKCAPHKMMHQQELLTRRRYCIFMCSRREMGFKIVFTNNWECVQSIFSPTKLLIFLLHK